MSGSDAAYGADCPVVVAYRVGWPDERVIRGTLADIRDKVKAAKITRTALIFVGRVLRRRFSDSRLYAAEHRHVLRPRAARARLDRRGEAETTLLG